MNSSSILIPMLVQVSLTLLVFVLLGFRKIAAIKTGKVDREKTALDNTAWPIGVVKVSNNISNQFQTPVIFYILIIFFYMTNSVTMSVVILSWVYSISRLIHAFVHVTSNFVPARFLMFMLGVICLLIMTIFAFIQLSTGI